MPRPVRMDYALNVEGELARAQDAPKGELYFCLDCRARVKLRRAEKNAPHFSHFGETGCSGEGVIHHAAKLELARALQERERPLVLEVPCSWPGCTRHVRSDLDGRLGFLTEVVTEYPHHNAYDGSHYRFDVAVLRHGILQAAFEIYHHHRVEGEKRRFANWFEVYAEPLLDDPYTLKMVRDSPPLNPELERIMQEYLASGQPDVTGVSYDAFYRYRAQASGLWIEERGWDISTPVAVPLDPDIDDFRFYACEEHLHARFRLENIVARQTWPQEITPDPEPIPRSDQTAYEVALDKLKRSAEFAADFYREQGVPAQALQELNLWACRCPHCEKPVVIVQGEFVRELRSFHGLVGVHERKAINRCAYCQKVIRREVISQRAGVSVPGALTAALLES